MPGIDATLLMPLTVTQHVISTSKFRLLNNGPRPGSKRVTRNDFEWTSNERSCNCGRYVRIMIQMTKETQFLYPISYA